MSLSRRCDICDTGYGKWNFKKRWSILAWINYIDGEFKEEMDICDGCINRFKEWMKINKEKRQ